MKGKKTLTKELMLEEYKYQRTIFLFSIFILAGIGVLLTPFTFWGGSWKKLLINMAAVSVLALPLGYFSGYRNIADIVRRVSGLKKNRILIIEDVVVDKHALMRDGTRASCQIELEEYAKRTGKTIWAESRLYNRAKKGDIFFVVYTVWKGKELFFGAYPAKEYDLDDNLRTLVKKP